MSRAQRIEVKLVRFDESEVEETFEISPLLETVPEADVLDATVRLFERWLFRMQGVRP